jgi:hypothetical protein
MAASASASVLTSIRPQHPPHKSGQTPVVGFCTACHRSRRSRSYAMPLPRENLRQNPVAGLQVKLIASPPQLLPSTTPSATLLFEQLEVLARVDGHGDACWRSSWDGGGSVLRHALDYYNCYRAMGISKTRQNVRSSVTPSPCEKAQGRGVLRAYILILQDARSF